MTTSPRYRLSGSQYISQWLVLGVVLLGFGLSIAYSLYQEHQRIEAREMERLATQTQLVERNLEPQIFSTRRAIDGILADLPSWQAEKGGLTRANQRLSVITDTLRGCVRLSSSMQREWR